MFLTTLHRMSLQTVVMRLYVAAAEGIVHGVFSANWATVVSNSLPDCIVHLHAKMVHSSEQPIQCGQHHI